MANPRRVIDRSHIDDEDDGSGTSLAQVDAALYGKLARIDGGRKAVERTRFGAFKLTSVGLEIGEGAQEKDWTEVGEFILRLDSGIQWLIGDWLLYGEAADWGKTGEIAQSLGRESQTLYNYAAVAKAIEFSRRRENLSFGHHEVVAKYDAARQDEYLDVALSYGLSVAKFRQWVREQEKGAQHRPALSSKGGFGSLAKEAGRFIERDPSTLKAEERTAGLDYIAQMRAVLDEWEARAKS